MNTEISTHDDPHRLGESATRPIEPRCGALAALLLLAGMSPPRRRALPAHRIATHSGASNCGFQVEKAMKATLFKHGVLVPRTHNIAQLLDVLDDAAIPAPPHADEIDSLNPYAVQARYGTLDAGALDRQVVEVWVNEVLAWAGLQVSGAGSA